MATVVGGSEDRRIDAGTLERFIADLFVGAGVPHEDADLLSEIIVGTDLRGIYSHGCALVPGYIDRMIGGQIDPRGTPRVVRDTGAALVVDGGNTLGHIGLTFGMRRAIERATTTGVAAVAVGGTNHCGAMASYAMLALPHHMIGIATTNGLPTMAWWGGIDRILSINPVGIAIPAGEEPAIVIDFSFGGAARGKIAIHHQKGLPLPEGWATDADGVPTTDPAAALGGLVQPAGGYKGTSMALVMGILSALLSGAEYGTDLGDFVNGPKPGRDGQFGLVLNVAAFEDPARFESRVDAIIRQIHGSRVAPGVDRILIPGELEVEAERRYRAEGVPLTVGTCRALADAAAKVGVGPGPVR
jgi:LDH2 family malate/lactate/ureidoglycolate dehydrogenase